MVLNTQFKISYMNFQVCTEIKLVSAGRKWHFILKSSVFNNLFSKQKFSNHFLYSELYLVFNVLHFHTNVIDIYKEKFTMCHKRLIASDWYRMLKILRFSSKKKDKKGLNKESYQ